MKTVKEFYKEMLKDHIFISFNDIEEEFILKCMTEFAIYHIEVFSKTIQEKIKHHEKSD